MRARSMIGIFLLGTSLFAARAHAIDAAGRIGRGRGERLERTNGEPCGALIYRTDGPYETGYAWFYGGNVPPEYGAFAECYSGSYEVCGVSLDLTNAGFFGDGQFEIYLWNDLDGHPGTVLSMRFIAQPGGIAMWPSVSRNLYSFTAPTCVDGAWWVGFRVTWDQWHDIYVAADLDGPLGCPQTNIAPGLGYPTGWQDVSVVWDQAQCLAIGAQTNPCLPVPNRRSTWGGIKRLYR
ncbi:MAG: hypothetical protein U0527_04645 [Candidatus Eisenbacteria bacterium]